LNPFFACELPTKLINEEGKTTMKPSLSTSALAIALGLGGVTCAYAQQSDLSVTLGLKGWNNRWETGQINTGFAGGGSNAQSFTSSDKLTAIPSVAVKYKDFFIAGSQFMKTSYGFPPSTSLGFAPGAAVATPNTQSQTADRKETDLNLGWYFVPQVAVTLGYKQVDQTYRNTFTPAAFSAFNSTGTTKNRAFTLGVAASAPIGNGGFFMYGNGATSISGMKAKFSGYASTSNPAGCTSASCPDWKGWYAASELGFGYRVQAGLSLTLGYKYQILDLGNAGQRGRDVTSGLIGGVSYTF
jgi:hypothetical protein